MTLTTRILAWLALAAAACLLTGRAASRSEETAPQPPAEGSATASRADFIAAAAPVAEEPPFWSDGFERGGRTAAQPEGWHYLRGGRLAEDADSPEGSRCLVFTANSPGRDAEIRRLAPLDGLDAGGLTIAVWVRLSDVAPGQFLEQRPALLIDFVDSRGEPLGRRRLGPWQGTFRWTRFAETLPLPPGATAVRLRIGLFGATGEAAFDGVEIRPAAVNPSVFPR